MPASLAPLIGRDFDFGGSELGLTVASFYLVCALASTPAGHLAQRIGADRAVFLTAATVVVSCLGAALFAQSTISLIVVLLLGGVGDAIAGPACSLALRREVPERRHGIAFGAQQAGAPLGALLAGLALPAIGIPLDWRWAFIAAAVFAIAAALAMPRGDQDPAAGGAESRPRIDPAQRRAVRRLAWAAALASAAGVSLVSFFVLEAVGHGIPESAAGLLLAVVSLAAASGRIAAGVASDRAHRDPILIAVAVLAVSSVGYLLLASGDAALIVAGALIGGMGWSWPGVLTLAVTQRAPNAAGWAVGVMMSGLFAGALAGPALAGVLFSEGRSELAWIGCGAASLLSALMLLSRAR